MTIIPAIDIIDGKCVRLTMGDYDRKTIYNEDPLEQAKAFEAAGVKRLHLVDLDGAKAGTVKNWKVLESITGNTGLEIDFSGGIKDEQTIRRVIELGTRYVSIGTLAVKNRNAFEGLVGIFGAERFIIGADVMQNQIVVNGWQSETGIDVFSFMSDYQLKGIGQFFCTDISKDGMLEGPSIPLYTEILSKVPGIYLIASGGVRSMDDVDALEAIGCKGVIIGKALYENRITIDDLKNYNQS